MSLRIGILNPATIGSTPASGSSDSLRERLVLEKVFDPNGVGETQHALNQD